MAIKGRKNRVSKKDVKKYRIIISRLHNTLANFQSQLPELEQVQVAVAAINFDYNHISPYVNHLKSICTALATTLPDSLILRQLHAHFCRDIRLLEEGNRLQNEAPHYLEPEFLLKQA